MSKISRRNFLQMVGAAAPAVFFPQAASWADKNNAAAAQPNVIILLFDAMSAHNLSVYGYPRLTTPNMERFAEHANVYHSHYAGGSFTIPGAATLLTGSYPWTSRAINYGGRITARKVEDNIFRALGSKYQRLVFPQNMWANLIAGQFAADIDTLMPADSFAKLQYMTDKYFPQDTNMASRALDDFIFDENGNVSLVFGSLAKVVFHKNEKQLSKEGYPRGLPHDLNYPIYFRLEDVFGGVGDLLPAQRAPLFAYMHFLPPHAPYTPTNKFSGKFEDDWKPPEKPEHRFSDHIPAAKLLNSRKVYDEYIASIDSQLGILFDTFEKAGVFENSYVIITADHGEMFERGEKAHSTPLLYDPVIHIPLLISTPRQKTRRDIYVPTSAADLLPTITHLTSSIQPAWAEGKPLPQLGGVEDNQRAIFSMDAKTSSAFAPLKKATIAMRKGNYKLIYYTGYEAEDSFELYDLENDIEEMKDLYRFQPAFANSLKQELLDSLSDANRPYIKS